MSDQYRRWVCQACGYIYYEADGDPDSGLAPGTRYEDIPEDWFCPLCGMKKSDLRLLPTAETPQKPLIQPERNAARYRGGEDYVVIVGAGVGGWSVAEEIRKRDIQHPLLLVSACEGLTYPKPALSEALSKGYSADDLVQFDAHSHAQQLDLNIRTDTPIIKIDRARKRLITTKGGIQYGSLVLALGARQRDLPIAGNGADSVLKINDLATYRTFRAHLTGDVAHVTILGGGLIGTEFAQDLSSTGVKVSIVDPADQTLVGLLPNSIARVLQQKLQANGVSWQFGQTLDRLERYAGRLRAMLSSGVAIDTDMVISAAGLIPNAALASKAGLKTSHGIITDNIMRTSDPDIFALGDCALVEGNVYSYIEPIKRQAQTIAAFLAGEVLLFEHRPTLVHVKTPSYPLAICPPSKALVEVAIRQSSPERCDYYYGDDLVGFVLSGASVSQSAKLYRCVCS